ncbi:MULTISPECIES: class F sortase [Cryobacterium]|uniref:Class F sortase n=1 Tax=Cryobacterium glucosi TaxID=1259175 RepID=A0ABY2IRJ2_9MICO|nr:MULTISPECIES: class F sortase [Cryobacterium]TFB96028.1 class F sortase [Cryobacterium sp. MDB2-A-1]TFC07934.1 class F sortase [Cryobacterium sp. MDB2-33-2]TFC13188.1 class F sortase [Cryobacterium sp. MDB2-A-2]TFC16323.1 class F sortase [Cryobacterium sp. MDB2-10]TFC23006.1 class F sortase [Cryobacterium glucosi]
MRATAGKIGMLAVALVLLSAAALMLMLMLSGCGSTSVAGSLAGAPMQLPATGASALPESSALPEPSAAAPIPPAPTATPLPPAVPLVTGVSADIRSVQGVALVAPVRIRIEALGIDMGIEAVGLGDTGGMGLPKNPAIAAWYQFGPAPASSSGATVIAAHVDSLEYDIGPFSRLATAPAGTDIVLFLADGGERRYRVESVALTLKPDVPWPAVFDRTGPARLTLVTCGGEFDYTARRYLSNVIVSAMPVP